MITQTRVRELFDYDPETGVLTWRVSPARNVPAGSVAGTKCLSGYRQVGIDGRLYRAHRIIWLHVHGELPQVLDHADGDPSNNCLANLRKATHSQNMYNQRMNRRNTSGFKGVSWCKQRRKWTANIRTRTKHKNLGFYATAREAATVYVLEALELHGEFFNPGEHLAKAA